MLGNIFLIDRTEWNQKSELSFQSSFKYKGLEGIIFIHSEVWVTQRMEDSGAQGMFWYMAMQHFWMTVPFRVMSSKGIKGTKE